jgi:hypothetical protein
VWARLDGSQTRPGEDGADDFPSQRRDALVAIVEQVVRHLRPAQRKVIMLCLYFSRDQLVALAPVLFGTALSRRAIKQREIRAWQQFRRVAGALLASAARPEDGGVVTAGADAAAQAMPPRPGLKRRAVTGHGGDAADGYTARPGGAPTDAAAAVTHDRTGGAAAAMVAAAALAGRPAERPAESAPVDATRPD